MASDVPTEIYRRIHAVTMECKRDLLNNLIGTAPHPVAQTTMKLLEDLEKMMGKQIEECERLERLVSSSTAAPARQ